MKVRELMAKMAECDPEAEVIHRWFSDEGYGHSWEVVETCRAGTKCSDWMTTGGDRPAVVIE